MDQGILLIGFIIIVTVLQIAQLEGIMRLTQKPDERAEEPPPVPTPENPQPTRDEITMEDPNTLPLENFEPDHTKPVKIVVKKDEEGNDVVEEQEVKNG